MAQRRTYLVLAALILLTQATISTRGASAAVPQRPGPQSGSNFHFFVGSESIDYDFDFRDAPRLATAGLDPIDTSAQVMIGVGWVFANPVRLDLVIGGGEVEIDRSDVTCNLGRFVADLHLALVETRFAALEATASIGSQILVYQDLSEDEFFVGPEVGVGITGRLSLVGPLGVSATYRYQQVKFQRANILLSADDEVRAHPTARFSGLRIAVHWDI